ARPEHDFRGARGDQRKGRDHVELGIWREEMVGEPERIEPPFLGTLGDPRDGLRRRHPEAPKPKSHADLDLFHGNALPRLPDCLTDTNMRRPDELATTGWQRRFGHGDRPRNG